MGIAALATVFAAGFLIMTPVGPVSTFCIRRSLIYGPLAGVAAGAGDALAVGIYASIGVTGSTFLPHLLAPYTTAWHIAISVVLLIVAALLWRARPMEPNVAEYSRSKVAGGLGGALLMALANPTDIVLFAALFAGLGVAVRTPLDHALFFATICAGGIVYWTALALVLNRWRAQLTTARVRWLNRGCSLLMVIGAAASLVSLAHKAG